MTEKIDYHRIDATYATHIAGVIAQGPFTDNWESLSHYRTPTWFEDAKFGIFIHWGVFSVPAFGSEWYPRNMYIQDSDEYIYHRKHFGDHQAFGYKDFIPMFTASKWDPLKWAQLFKDSGARYVVPVAEHHDGFQMYRSQLSHYNAYEMGPKRDVAGELKLALNESGLIYGASSHRIEHWWFLGHGREFESDVNDSLQRGDLYWPAQPEYKEALDVREPQPSPEYMNDWLLRCCELVDRYQPKEVYFDWWIEQLALKPYLMKFAAYYYNRAAEWGFTPVIAYKYDAMMFGSALPDVERGQFNDTQHFAWQTDTSIARNSWSWTPNNDYKSPKEVLQTLIDVVSKNGNLLLNVGPRADGTIAPEEEAVLRTIGGWLAKNGQAIYGTRPWRISGEGPTQATGGQFTDASALEYTEKDIRFTVGNGHLYAIFLAPPSAGKVNIVALAKNISNNGTIFSGEIKTVNLLGNNASIDWVVDANGLHVTLPTLSDSLPLVIELSLY